MEELEDIINMKTDDLLRTCIGMDTSTWSPIAQQRLRLPIRMKGCGLRDATDCRHAQYIGAMIQITNPLPDRKDCNDVRLTGRLLINPIINLIGKGSLDHPSQQPWANLLSKSRSGATITSSLQHAWSHLTSNFQYAVQAPFNTDTLNYLLRKEVLGAGFYMDGTIAVSVTNLLTIELDKCRGKQLSLDVMSMLYKGEYKQWAFDGWNNTSTGLLLSPPDQFGYFGDTVF